MSRRGRRAPPAAPLADDNHTPVLLDDVVRLLAPRPGGSYIDGTVGLGGHAAALLTAAGPGARLLGIDADPDALTIARERLARYGGQVTLVRGNFADLAAAARAAGFDRLTGVLLDLGVSSLQFGPRGRGFTIRWDQPLDMRMDPTLPVTARDIVNEWAEEDLANVIYRFGEERRSRAIARAIVRARPLNTTVQLARTIEQAVGGAGSRTHPATQTFQALRIAVNGELDSLTTALREAHDLLDAPGGRMAVISYHSLEDRIVKDFFRQASQQCICPPELPICRCDHRASLRLVTRGAVQPSPTEVAANPRARSARLRVAERLPVDPTGLG